MTDIIPNPGVRYITVWPADTKGVTHFEALLLEISPKKDFVRVLWGYNTDGTPDQEWLPSADFDKAIVAEVPLTGPVQNVLPPTALGLRNPGRGPWPTPF